jgi:hypothetical protein
MVSRRSEAVISPRNNTSLPTTIAVIVLGYCFVSDMALSIKRAFFARSDPIQTPSRTFSPAPAASALCCSDCVSQKCGQPRFVPRCLVELFGRYSLDELAMRLKLSPQIPRPAIPTTSQVTKRGIADLALERFSVDVNRNSKGVPKSAQIRFGLL